MVGFVVRRLVLAVVVLLAFSLASFCLFAGEFCSTLGRFSLAAPGSRSGNASQCTPLPGRDLLPAYGHWLAGIATGRSLAHGVLWPVPSPLLTAVAHTTALLAVTLVLVLVLGLSVGVICAVWPRSTGDVLLRGGSYVLWAVPTFLLALLVEEAITRLGGQHGWGPFPVSGWAGSCPVPLGLNAGQILPCPSAGSGFGYVANVLRCLVLPALTLAAGFVGLHARYLRTSLATALVAPFTTTARAKGVAEWRVVLRHALRNALAPFVGAVLSDLGALFSGALAVDWLFQLNGVGSLFIREVGIDLFQARSFVVDIYALQALLLVTALLLLASSVLAEYAVLALDPRIRPD